VNIIDGTHENNEEEPIEPSPNGKLSKL